MSDKIIQFPGCPKTKGQPLPPVTPEEAVLMKAAGIIQSMPFILIGIHDHGDGADLFTVVSGDKVVLQQFLPHLQEKAAAAIERMDK